MQPAALHHGLAFNSAAAAAAAAAAATAALNPPSAVAGFLVDGAGGSQGGLPGWGAVQVCVVELQNVSATRCSMETDVQVECSCPIA
jgi:hypothetical protein